MGLKKYKLGELIEFVEGKRLIIEFVEGKRLIIPRLCKSLKYCTILLNNCGEVGHVCESTNDQHMVTPVCNAGVCQFGACEANYGVCNEDMLSEEGDGCETPLNTTSNCGACGKTCGSDRVCSDGVCCIGEGIVTDDAKSHDCCSGLKKYSKCTLNLGILGCLTRSYQCAATQPEGYEEWE